MKRIPALLRTRPRMVADRAAPSSAAVDGDVPDAAVWSKPLRLPSLMGVVMVAVALSACDRPPQTGQEHADEATRAACRQRADETYNQQNRAEIYSPPPTVNTPYSANYTPGITDRGLSDLFVHDRMISDCIRNTGTGAERNPPSPLKR
jgi:hypothetical protein